MDKEKDLYIIILSHLSKYGINHEIDIFDIFKNSFTKADHIHEVVWKMRGTNHINRFLKGIKDNGHIEFKEIEEHETINNTISWNDRFPVLVSITAKGFHYINEHELTRSNFAVNDASVRNYKSQFWLSISTIGLALLTAIITILTFIETKTNGEKMDVLQTHILPPKSVQSTMKLSPKMPLVDPSNPSSKPNATKLDSIKK